MKARITFLKGRRGGEEKKRNKILTIYLVLLSLKRGKKRKRSPLLGNWIVRSFSGRRRGERRKKPLQLDSVDHYGKRRPPTTGDPWSGILLGREGRLLTVREGSGYPPLSLLFPKKRGKKR